MSPDPKLRPLLRGQPRFDGNRVRFQRLRDARFFTGWVTNFVSGSIEIQVNDREPIRRGEEFAVEVAGEESTAHFRAVVSVADERGVRLKLTEAVRYLPPQEAARYRASGIWCAFTDGGRRIIGEVVELSVDGIGLYLSEPVRPGAEIAVAITDTIETVMCEAEIRYCRTDREVPGRFRAGLHLQAIPRSQAPTWELLRRKVMK